MYAVDVMIGAGFVYGKPRVLFETTLRVSNTFDQFAVASKERFLFRLPFGEDPQAPVHVVLGWDR